MLPTLESPPPSPLLIFDSDSYHLASRFKALHLLWLFLVHWFTFLSLLTVKISFFYSLVCGFNAVFLQALLSKCAAGFRAPLWIVGEIRGRKKGQSAFVSELRGHVFCC